VFGLSTWESAARRGACGAGADIGGAGRAAGDAGEVTTAGADHEEVGKIGVGVASCGRGEILEGEVVAAADGVWCPSHRQGEVPMKDRAFGTTRVDDGMHRVPCCGCLMRGYQRHADSWLKEDRVMPMQDNPFLHRANIEYSHCLVA
jgi:hypothetical protein